MEIFLNVIYVILLSVCIVYNTREALYTRKRTKCIIYSIVAGICIATLVSRTVYIMFSAIRPPMNVG